MGSDAGRPIVNILGEAVAVGPGAAAPGALVVPLGQRLRDAAHAGQHARPRTLEREYAAYDGEGGDPRHVAFIIYRRAGAGGRSASPPGTTSTIATAPPGSSSASARPTAAGAGLRHRGDAADARLRLHRPRPAQRALHRLRDESGGLRAYQKAGFRSSGGGARRTGWAGPTGMRFTWTASPASS